MNENISTSIVCTYILISDHVSELCDKIGNVDIFIGVSLIIEATYLLEKHISSLAIASVDHFKDSVS